MANIRIITLTGTHHDRRTDVRADGVIGQADFALVDGSLYEADDCGHILYDLPVEVQEGGAALVSSASRFRPYDDLTLRDMLALLTA